MRLTLIERLEAMFASDRNLYMVRHNPQQAKKLSTKLANQLTDDTGLVADALYNTIEGWKSGEITAPKDPKNGQPE